MYPTEILLLVIVLVAVGYVYAARRRPAHVMGTGNAEVRPRTPAISAAGRLSLILLVGALLVRSVTLATLPVYYAATLAGASFAVAVVAKLRYHDRSTLLWVPLSFVPLAAAFSLAFVLLQ